MTTISKKNKDSQQETSEQQDNVENTVLILKSHAGSLTSAEAFLKNRRWEIKSTANLREAIAYILQNQPAYIMITSDHPNKKVNLLPKMLAAAVVSKIIGFSEKGTTLSTQTLHQMNLEYNLYPPVSGPAIERMILKIRRDSLHTKTEREKSIQKSGSNTSEEAMLTFKSDQMNSEKMKINLAGAQEALRSLISGEDLENSNIASATTAEPFDPSYFSEPSQKSHETTEEGKPDHSSGSEESISSSDSIDPSKNSEGENFPSTDRTAHFRHRRESIHYDGKKASEKTPYKMQSEPESNNSSSAQSILVRGTEAALNESVDRKAHPVLNSRPNLPESDMACITIDSPRFSGYLICAFGRQRPVDQALMQMIKNKLFGFLKANGEQLKEKSLLTLKLQEVDFSSWAMAQADFLKKSLHAGDEIAIAFFPKNVSDIQTSDSVIEKMVQVGIHDIKEDSRVEFDLYVYMPANKKFLLYTPKGRTFYKNQKGRLMESGIKHLHLKRDEAHELNKYQAQVFLNEKIARFRR